MPQESTGELVRMITIYRGARDYPQFEYVARQWFVAAGKVWASRELWASGDTLDDVRRSIPAWMACLARQEGDDPVIVETWI
jgi:hypothetical protein